MNPLFGSLFFKANEHILWRTTKFICLGIHSRWSTHYHLPPPTSTCQPSPPTTTRWRWSRSRDPKDHPPLDTHPALDGDKLSPMSSGPVFLLGFNSAILPLCFSTYIITFQFLGMKTFYLTVQLNAKIQLII